MPAGPSLPTAQSLSASSVSLRECTATAWTRAAGIAARTSAGTCAIAAVLPLSPWPCKSVCTLAKGFICQSGAAISQDTRGACSNVVTCERFAAASPMTVRRDRAAVVAARVPTHRRMQRRHKIRAAQPESPRRTRCRMTKRASRGALSVANTQLPLAGRMAPCSGLLTSPRCTSLRQASISAPATQVVGVASQLRNSSCLWSRRSVSNGTEQRTTAVWLDNTCVQGATATPLRGCWCRENND
jgi:hypothetical protein